MVIHWNTVSTAKRMLSNWVMPSFGPIHEPLQSYFSGHLRTPQANSTSEESTVSLSDGNTNPLSEKNQKNISQHKNGKFPTWKILENGKFSALSPICFNSHSLLYYLMTILTKDVQLGKAGVVQLAAVELQADDSEHQDSKEQQEADLQQRNHRLDDGLQNNLQTWCYTWNSYFNTITKSVAGMDNCNNLSYKLYLQQQQLLLLLIFIII